MFNLLKGVRVLDLTSVLMGPYATQMLGDYGADVIKVEAPGGDVTRQIGPSRNQGMGPVFLHANRNKRSIGIDLKSDGGRAALLKLVETADILVYNLRPQAMERLGLGYDAIRGINPRIVYAGLFGFGQDGPYAAKAAYDDLIQGASTLSALMASSGSDRPRYVPSAIADRIVGLYAVGGILAALHRRQSTGTGTRIDFPMFETMVSFTLGDHMGGLTYSPPLDGGGYARQLSPYRRPYKTSDGYVCALIYNDKQWNAFAKALHREKEFAEDPRRASIATRLRHIDALYEELETEFARRTTQEWTELLDRHDIPVMPMHDLTTIFGDAHLQAVGLFRDVDHPSEGPIRTLRTPVSCDDEGDADRPAPLYGQHGREILSEAGFDGGTIDRLISTGAVKD